MVLLIVFMVFIIKSIVAFIPFVFISHFGLFGIHRVNILCFFGLQIGAIFGIVLGKYIHRYGKKNAIIFGGILFCTFAVQFFINQSIDSAIIILILAGFGYGIVCYEIFYSTEVKKSEIYTHREKILFYIIFICFYVNIWLVLIANAFKIGEFNNSAYTFLFFLFYAIIIFVIEQYSLFYKKTNFKKYLLLMVIGFWFSGLSTDAIIFVIGSVFMAISCAVISQHRKVILQNNSAVNFQMLTGYIIAGMITLLTRNAIGINNLYYLAFILGIVLIAFAHFSGIATRISST